MRLNMKKNSKLAEYSYKKCFIVYLVMDCLADKKPKNLSEVHSTISSLYNKDLWYTSHDLMLLEMNKLAMLGLLTITDNPEELNKYTKYTLTITDKGFEMLQSQTFQGLFASSFLGYQSYKLSKIATVVSIIATIIALVSLLYAT